MKAWKWYYSHFRWRELNCQDKNWFENGQFSPRDEHVEGPGGRSSAYQGFHWAQQALKLRKEKKSAQMKRCPADHAISLENPVGKILNKIIDSCFRGIIFISKRLDGVRQVNKDSINDCKCFSCLFGTVLIVTTAQHDEKWPPFYSDKLPLKRKEQNPALWFLGSQLIKMDMTGEAKAPEQLSSLFSGMFLRILSPYFQTQCLLIPLQHPSNQPPPKNPADVVWEKSWAQTGKHSLQGVLSVVGLSQTAKYKLLLWLIWCKTSAKYCT